MDITLASKEKFGIIIIKTRCGLPLKVSLLRLTILIFLNSDIGDFSVHQRVHDRLIFYLKYRRIFSIFLFFFFGEKRKRNLGSHIKK